MDLAIEGELKAQLMYESMMSDCIDVKNDLE
jgi:hypothetical protein